MSARPSPSSVLSALKSAGDKRVRDEMGPRYGIVAKDAFGVPMAKIKAIAKEIGRDHDLAIELWKSGNYDARLLCSMIADPARVTPALMDRWRRDFDNWGVCDTLCFNLFDKTPYAFAKVEAWAALNDEFGKRAAFALLASLALHDKKSEDATFARLLPLCAKAASDDRNFVKKAVSWALRAIGSRRAKLHDACIATATRLAASEDATERWVGKDVLRDLSRPLVKGRLAKKK
ncbi:MAG: DNA alkylation repair protein, partial [Terricaulis sp.]